MHSPEMGSPKIDSAEINQNTFDQFLEKIIKKYNFNYTVDEFKKKMTAELMINIRGSLSDFFSNKTDWIKFCKAYKSREEMDSFHLELYNSNLGLTINIDSEIFNVLMSGEPTPKPV